MSFPGFGTQERSLRNGWDLARFWHGHKLVWAWAAGVVVWVAIVGVPSSRPQIFAIVGLGLHRVECG